METAPPCPKRDGCDDTRADVHRPFQAYADRDGDGVGTPPRVVRCLDDGLPPPPGDSIHGFDPDDADLASRDTANESGLDEFLFTP
ncbi:hypothetical protein [Cystobacter ferrugineus]|uniref:Uncharacterized protein n=1 Tax=Cystobacter ferrugineus TaxID=83449 RepID=A0A1L9B1G4_9BACT|nr:hypothetical protein [Cystobacter ferrugineus]OJH36023.1 hypothetical protein BON30_36095 [Cystobacter ferrugineus]